MEQRIPSPRGMRSNQEHFADEAFCAEASLDEGSLAEASQLDVAASAALVAQLSQLRVEVLLRRGGQTAEAALASKSVETCQRSNQDLQQTWGFHCSPATSSGHLLFKAPPLRPSQTFPIGGAAAAAAPLLAGRRPASAPTSRPASAASVRPARASRPAVALRSTSATASRPPSAARARPSSAPASRANTRTPNAKVADVEVAGNAVPEIVLPRTLCGSYFLSSPEGFAGPRLSQPRWQGQRAAGVNSSRVRQRVAPFAFDASASQSKPTPSPVAAASLRTKATQDTNHFSFLVHHIAVRCGQDKPAARWQTPAC